MRGPVSRLRNHAVREATRRWVFAEAQARHDRLRGAMGLPPDGLDVLQAAVSPMLHLQACTPSFEYPVPDLPATVHWVGALRPDPPTPWVPPSWWDEVRAPTRPVVHVTQGSIRPDMRELVVPTLRALARDDVLVVVTTGGVPRAGARGAYGGAAAGQRPGQRVHPLRPAAAARRRVRDQRRLHRCHHGPAPRRAAGAGRLDRGEGRDRGPGGWSGVGVRIRPTSPRPLRLRTAVRASCTTRGTGDAAQRMGAELRRHDAAEEGADLLERLADTGAPGDRAGHPGPRPLTCASTRLTPRLPRRLPAGRFGGPSGPVGAGPVTGEPHGTAPRAARDHVVAPSSSA